MEEHTVANKSDKLSGEKRRELILEWLVHSNKPITGKDLAAKTNVSRQVIVQDISLLKAKSHPILATSQGYIVIPEQKPQTVQKQIACFHSSDLSVTEEELNIIVDHGAQVIDVSIEHPLYGDITASLMLSSRSDIQNFIKKLQQTSAPLLSELTDGTHLHTIEASSYHVIEEVESALNQKEFLLT
ncbi:transcription repressor NadR [Salibacterium salarium]|uniref:Transcription repressor NadR n=1 Tax=Salibacterium salarium TaxID=284579 RepID=A0A3R9PBE0_9BACI|nr:transcription repressor NadR [Salibacterium salarium]